MQLINPLVEKDIDAKSLVKELNDIKFALDQSSILAITNQKGNILSVNERFCEISQYSHDELIGQNHRILNSSYHTKEFFKQMWATIGKGEVWKGEIRNKAKDGSFYWVDTTIVPFLNQLGKPYQYVSIRNDISDRKKMEEDILESEKKYRLITENAFDLISIIDKEGHFKYLSPSHLTILGHNLSNLQSSHLFEYVHEKDQKSLDVELSLLAAKKKLPTQIEFRIRTSMGTYKNMETRINPILEKDDVINAFVFVMRDITEQKESEEKIYRLSYHDTLTALPNRRMFMQLLERRWRKQNLSPLS